MTLFLVGLVVGLCAGGAIVYLFRAKGEAVVADVKKDLSV